MIRFQIKMQEFNGTIRRNEVSRKSNPKDLHFDDMGIPTGILINCDVKSQLVRMWPSLQLGHMSDCRAVSHISTIARRPVSALWTLNYTTSSTEAMSSGNRYYWKVRALDEGGEQ